jgi:hypothetical protein
MLTASGPGLLKTWYLGPDGSFRTGALLPPAKENETFIDHCWLPLMIGGAMHKMVALTDPDSAIADGAGFGLGGLGGMGSAASVASGPSASLGGSSLAGTALLGQGQGQQAGQTGGAGKKQTVFIFEGSDVSNSGNTVTAPINMELKQTLSLRLDHGSAGLLQASASASNSLAGSGFGYSAPRLEAIVPTTKGFILVGGNGHLAMYERIDDKREPYVETKRVSLGDLRVCYATICPSGVLID